MLPLGDSQSVIEFLVQRTKADNLRPIVFTSRETSDDIIYNECKRLNVEYFRGDLHNKILRWKDGLEYFGLDWAHFADMDDPFLDTSQIRQSVEIFNSRSLDMLGTSKLSDSGFASVGASIKSTFLEKLVQRVKNLNNQDLDVIPWHLIIHNTDAVDQFQDIKYVKRTDFRLTLDYAEDYKLLSSLARTFGPEVSRRDLESYLDGNPSLLNINKGRVADFRQNKITKLNTFETNARE